MRYGEWVILVCAIVLLGATGVALRRRARPSRFIDSAPPAGDEPLSVDTRIAEYKTVAPYRPAPEGADSGEPATRETAPGDLA